MARGKASEKKKQAKTKKATGTKRGPSAYILFSKDMRETVKKEHPEAKPQEIVKILGAQWKELDDEEKAKWTAKAKAAKPAEASSSKSKKKAKHESEDEEPEEHEEEHDEDDEEEEDKHEQTEEHHEEQQEDSDDEDDD